jgi:hypothetical protein
MPRVIVCVLVALLALPAGAEVVGFKWINPTQNTDGSALPASQIQRTQVDYGSCNGAAFGTKAGQFVFLGAVTDGLSTDLAPGVYCFRAFTRREINGVGAWSGSSNVLTRTITPPVPIASNPPVLSFQ